MIPSTTGTVFAFFLFVAPGVVFDLLSARRRAGVPETAFREASRVVLASTAFTSLAVVVLTVPGLAWPSLRQAIWGWLSGRTPLSATEPFLLIAMTAVALVACALAGLAHCRLARGGSTGRQTSAWSQVLRTEAPDGSAPYVRVKTTSGSTYTGFVGSYSPDLEVSGRELVLIPPLWSAGPGRSLAPVEKWSRIVLSGHEIAVLMVDYRPHPQETGVCKSE